MDRDGVEDTVMARRVSRETEPESYEVTVWGLEGEIVRKLWEATYEEAEEVREEYADDPFRTVVVDRREWQAAHA